MNRGIANAVAGTTPATVEDVFERHASPRAVGLRGSSAGGRWGPPFQFSVLYLGQPRENIVAEAYRSLVDPVEGMTGSAVGPRRVFTVRAKVTDLLDLRVAEHLAAVGLTTEALSGPWEPCRRVATAAHQLGMNGIVTPSATGLGTTLALFEQHLPEDQWPEIISEETWAQLPPDPRALRLADRSSG